MMKTRSLFLGVGAALVLVGLPLASGCNGFGSVGSGTRLVVTRTGGDVGAPDRRLPITFTSGPKITYRIEAQNRDGTPNTDFEGWIRVSSKPGTVASLSGPNVNGRNVKMVGGVANDVTVEVAAAFGDTRVWFDDQGYEPTPLGAADPPQCANGLDDDGDGRVDFPADPGCLSPDDATESGATFATGVSDPIYFAQPRVADVRGVAELGGRATAFPSEQVRLDTGWRPESRTFAFDVIVTRIASDGFNVTDVADQNARGFASVFAFTFSPPARLRVCDRLRALSGTAVDFFGFTELAFPTWAVEYWDPRVRPCGVPEPRVLAPNELTNLDVLFRYQSALVRLQTGGNVEVRVGAHFGPDKVPNMGGTFVPGPNASSCDLDGSGKLDFAKPDEAACSAACTADPDCSEFTNFVSQGNFSFAVVDKAAMTTGKMQANGSASPDFDPLLLKGKVIGAFSGTIRYFSGGRQFTIEARCGDDIVVDPSGVPLPSDKACVRPRTDLDNNEGTR
jgi:hypothetical protein